MSVSSNDMVSVHYSRKKDGTTACICVHNVLEFNEK